MTEEEHDDLLVEVGAKQLDDLLRLVRPAKRDIIAERIAARVRAIRSRRISSLALPVQNDPRREPETDPDPTPPRPYSPSELRAAADPKDPRSGVTTPGGFRPQRKP